MILFKGKVTTDFSKRYMSIKNQCYQLSIFISPVSFSEFSPLNDVNTHRFLCFQDWWNDLLHENNYKELDYSGKMVLLLDILVMSSDVGDKSLVFSQSIPTLDLIELYLSRLPCRGKKGKFWRKEKDWYRCVSAMAHRFSVFVHDIYFKFLIRT